jgi:hypothetical protein
MPPRGHASAQRRHGGSGGGGGGGGGPERGPGGWWALLAAWRKGGGRHLQGPRVAWFTPRLPACVLQDTATPPVAPSPQHLSAPAPQCPSAPATTKDSLARSTHLHSPSARCCHPQLPSACAVAPAPGKSQQLRRGTQGTPASGSPAHTAAPRRCRSSAPRPPAPPPPPGGPGPTATAR